MPRKSIFTFNLNFFVKGSVKKNSFFLFSIRMSAWITREQSKRKEPAHLNTIAMCGVCAVLFQRIICECLELQSHNRKFYYWRKKQEYWANIFVSFLSFYIWLHCIRVLRNIVRHALRVSYIHPNEIVLIHIVI